MVWNISAECISAIILCIIWVYSSKGNLLPTLQNKFFRVCFVVTFLSITSNIAATFLLYNFEAVPLSLTWAVNIVYFSMTPLMGVFYFDYVVAIVVEGTKNVYKMLRWTSIPAAAYLVFVFTAPVNGLLFNIDPAAGYSRGPLIFVTYILFYIYCFACPLLVLFKGRRLDRPIRRILVSFPIIAAVVIVIQQIIPEYILTGSAATCALLIIYLYLQNKQISLDHLTNLQNRQEFLKMLDLKTRHHGNPPFTAMVLSLKNFKNINDKFGQENGNRFLKELALYLCSIAGADRLYRYSGDEFAWIIDSTDRKCIEPPYQELARRMTLPWETDNCSCLLSYALGIVQYPMSASTAEDLIDGIESAVSRAKQSSKSHVCYCTPEMLRQIKRRDMIIEILKDRLEHDSFEVAYQPILSIAANTFDKAEALLRLGDTPIGPVYPSEFIPIAEETGLIIDITYQVLGKVCRFVKDLSDSGTDIQSVSVNFSSVQFTQEDVSERVFGIIEESGADFSKIKIEITESVLMENYEVLKDFIDAIHAKGVRFALDDFGMGYSNISTVLGFPINTVKLDKSLVWSSIENPKSKAIVRHMVAAFKELGIDTLAEGVEDEEQRQFVVRCGCDMIQGFFYSKPLPEDEARNFLGKSPVDSPRK